MSFDVLNPNKNDPWTIYVLDGCPFCKKVKNMFIERGYKLINSNEKTSYILKGDKYVIVHNINRNDKEQFKKKFIDILDKYSHYTFPIIFQNDKFIGGLNDFIEYYYNAF